MVRLIYSSNKFRTDYDFEGSRLIPAGKLSIQVFCPNGFSEEEYQFIRNACSYFEDILQMNNHTGKLVQVTFIGEKGIISEGAATMVFIESGVSFH